MVKKGQGVSVSITKVKNSTKNDVSSYQIKIDNGLQTLLTKCKSAKFGTKDEEHFGIIWQRFLISNEYFRNYHLKEDQILFDTELVLNGKKIVKATEQQINSLNAYLQVNIQNIVDNLVLFAKEKQ